MVGLVTKKKWKGSGLEEMEGVRLEKFPKWKGSGLKNSLIKDIIKKK